MSFLDILKPITKLLPEVKTPTIPPSFGERMIWTLLALAIFFVMYNVAAVGVDPRITSQSDFLQVVTASKLGSLDTTGITPIVMASIFLQLLVGSKLLDVNMQDPEQRTAFYGVQKLASLCLCIIFAYVYTVRLPFVPVLGLSVGLVQWLVVVQVALGSIVLLYLDEVVAKHGIGSGISLFIAGNVALSIVGGTVALFVGDTGVLAALSGGGAEVIANAVFALLPLFFTLIVFLIIVYVEGIKLDIPLSIRGFSVPYSIKFTYLSNMPVILAFSLIQSMALLYVLLATQHLCIGGSFNAAAPDPFYACSGGIDLVNYFGRTTAPTGSQPQAVDGLLYLISPIYRPLGNNYGGYFDYILKSSTPILHIPEWLHVITYTLFLMVLCVLFGMFWVETTGMDAKSVAEQLDNAGLQIPGYRRDPRVFAALLEKYIPPIVVMGSAFVGLLAAMADLTGALGTGTGILLTVGIVYKMYQDMERQNAFSSNALMSGLMGK